MAGDDYEPNRVLGMPWRTGPHAGQGKEPQRVMGFPVDWFGSADLGWLRSLAHPVLGYRRWVRRRRLGPYATDDDEPRNRLRGDGL
jgi:hypothetical protein